MILQSEKEFYDLIKQEKITVIYFYANWCGPCKSFGPIFEKVSQNIAQINMKKVDIDSLVQIAIDYGIQSIPTLVVFKNGQEIERNVGVISNLQTWVNNLISNYN